MGVAEFLSGLGSTGSTLALFFVAFSSQGSAADAAYVSAAYMVLYMLASFVSPAVSARFDHRRVVVLQVVLKALIFVLPWVLSLTGNLTVGSIILVMGLTGLVTGATQPAYYHVLQDLSPERGVSAANAFIGSRYSAAAVIGAIVGGAVLAATGPTWLLFANVLSYLPLLWVLLRLPDRAAGTPSGEPRPHMAAALADLFGTRVLRLGILLDLAVVALSIPTSLLTKLANGVGTSATYYGIVSAASGFGMVLTMPLLARLNARRQRPGVVVGAIVVLALGLLLTGVVGATGQQGVPGVLLLSLAVCLAFLGSFAAGDKLLAVVQVSAPGAERTVAIAAITFSAMAAATVTTLVEGALADVLPVWWIQLVAGAMALTLALVGVVAFRRGWLPTSHASTT
jgi:MFS family permease